MFIRLDAVGNFSLTNKQFVNGERYYYATEDYPLVLLVSRIGPLYSLHDTVVDCAVGWDPGTPGFVWRPGVRHTKITVFQRAAAGTRADMTLKEICSGPNRPKRRG